ncbi:hypothetical protein [Neobacillus notoginsengisoli]|nr:hypothetical protein [Neobacillus notoginsengisoli]
MKTKDDFLKGAKITSDSHVYGPPNGGSENHHSPQSSKKGVRGNNKKQDQ